MAEKHEQLPELSDEPRCSPRDTTPDMPDESDYSDMDMSKPLGRPNRPVSQWKLLRIMREQNKGRLTLSDLRWMFELPDNDDSLIQQGLNQLLSAGRVRRVTGTSQRTQMVGVVYLVTARGAKDGSTSED